MTKRMKTVTSPSKQKERKINRANDEVKRKKRKKERDYWEYVCMPSWSLNYCGHRFKKERNQDAREGERVKNRGKKKITKTKGRRKKWS